MRLATLLAALLGALLLSAPSALAQDLNKEERQVIAKSLAWLVKAQHKDGHWEANAGNYPVAMTALAGLALLMEGSTPFEGQYSDQLCRAVSWLVTHSQEKGLIGKPDHISEAGRYMYGHGYALLFLANVYDRCAPEENPAKPKDRREAFRQKVLHLNRLILRKELEPVLKSAVAFSVKAQCAVGG